MGKKGRLVFGLLFLFVYLGGLAQAATVAEPSRVLRFLRSRKFGCGIAISLLSPALLFAALLHVGTDHETPNATNYVPVSAKSVEAAVPYFESLFAEGQTAVSFRVEDALHKIPGANFFGRNWRQEIISRAINGYLDPPPPGTPAKAQPSFLKVVIEGIALQKSQTDPDWVEITLIGERYAVKLPEKVRLKDLESGEVLQVQVTPPSGSIPAIGKAFGGGYLKFSYSTATGELFVHDMFSELTVTMFGHPEHDEVSIQGVKGTKAQLDPKPTVLIPGPL